MVDVMGRRSPHQAAGITGVLAGTSRAAVLDALRDADRPLPVKDLAQRVGLHTSTLRFHLNRLVEAGLVHEERADPDGPGRPGLVYSTVEDTGEAGEESGERGYKFLARVLAAHLAATSGDAAGEADDAGQVFGRYLVGPPRPFDTMDAEHARARLVLLLDELGFDPHEATDAGRIVLHRCPFREVAEDNPEVTCAVHLGLMRGALEELRAPIEATGLDPFVTPTTCVAHLSTKR